MKNIPPETQKKIIDLIAVLIPQAKIYLFGSRARGTHSDWSDIDLALDAGEELPIVLIGEAKDVLRETNIPYIIDIVDIHNISDEMKNIIKKESIAWKP